MDSVKSNGWSTSYYEIPDFAKELQDLIEYKDMNFAVANIFKAAYRLGGKEGTDPAYDLRKIMWFAQRELDRLESVKKAEVVTDALTEALKTHVEKPETVRERNQRGLDDYFKQETDRVAWLVANARPVGSMSEAERLRVESVDDPGDSVGFSKADGALADARDAARKAQLPWPEPQSDFAISDPYPTNTKPYPGGYDD